MVATNRKRGIVESRWPNTESSRESLEDTLFNYAQGMEVVTLLYFVGHRAI